MIARELDDEIKWLNMDPVPDKESEEHGDTVLLSEIIANSIRQEIVKVCKSNFYAINIALKYIVLLTSTKNSIIDDTLENFVLVSTNRRVEIF